MEKSSGKKRILKGIVISNKMAKTIVVEVHRLKKHSKYLKYFKVSTRMKAHAENEKDYAPGDTVRIEETRPLSKGKRWKVIEVVRRSKEAPPEIQEEEETKKP